ncbi:MAG: NUMOD4 motif-containing HNH endonuclease [Bradyrhizobium sp.]|uniref:NUMOD4 motif-containing HNH endonuclease n=1 Tax=Bradyrhizobium sp. TaxID=376 RepID=UPI003D1178B7
MHDQSVPEEWRSVVDFPAYSVSDQGRVRRELSNQGGTAGRILKCSPNGCGYLQMQFWAGRTKRERIRLVHHLVMEAFIGQRPEGMTVNHKNGLKTDNRLANLEYCTQAENNRHAREVLGFRPGQNSPAGVDHYKAKITEDQVRELRRLHAAGGGAYALGKSLGLKKGAIWALIHRKSWKHVE